MLVNFTKHSRRLFRQLCIMLLCTLCASYTGFAQQAQETVLLTGTVTDRNKEPLPGVTVVVANTLNGTFTNVNGTYSLRIPKSLDPSSKIKFTMIGMLTVEIEYGKQERIDAVMQEDAKELEGVVVTGLFNMHNRDMTGAVTTFKLDSLLPVGAGRIEDALQGQVAGLVAITPSMRAGSSPQITIRGRSTLLGTTEPLWVIDGIVQSSMQNTAGVWDTSIEGMNELLGSAVSWLNPQDVESVSILKDASATAVYGSRASNGVIVVTTKKGTAGRLSLRAGYNLTVGQQLNYSLYNLMNSQERINFSKYAYNAGVYYQKTPIAQEYTYEGMYNLFLSGRLPESDFIKQYNYLETLNTDWFEHTTRPSVNQNFSVSASGGAENVTYMVSASYLKNNATEKGNSAERFTGRVGIDLTLKPNIRVSASIIGTMSTTAGFAPGIDPIGYATSTSRAIPAYNRDGSLAFYQVREKYKYNSNTDQTGLPYNIIDDMNNTSSELTNPKMQATMDFKWRLTSDLTWQVVAGYMTDSRSSETWMGENSFSVVSGYRGYRLGTPEALDQTHRNAAILKNGGILITDHTSNRSYNVRNQLNYKHSFKNNHRLTAMAMWEAKSTLRNSKYNTVFGYDKARGERIANPTIPTDLHPIGEITQPSDYVDTYLQLQKGYWRSTNFIDNQTSLAMIVAYTINDKYVINANFRNDWSNTFGQNANKRFNPAWSLGVSWKLGEENFTESIRHWLSAANLRLTYGTQGNVANTQTTEMVLQYRPIHPLFNEPYSAILRIANPYMTWERTSNWNAGLDLGLFNNKISVVIDGYTRLSNVGRNFSDTPENGGFQSTLTGTYIRNTGIEGTISFTPVQTDSWRVIISANAAKNWSVIAREEQSNAVSYTIDQYVSGSTSESIVKGKPLGAFWAYPYTGPEKDYGIPTFRYFHSATLAGYTEAEKAKEPINVLTYAGTKIADISGGFTLRVGYKKLTMTSQFAATLGGKVFLYNPYSTFYLGRMPEPTANLNRELLGMWTKENKNSNFPGLYIVPSEMDYPLQLADPTSLAGTPRDRYSMWAQSDARLASMSTLRCRNISLTWSINAKNAKGALAATMQRLGVQNMDLTAAVNNVFLIADSKWNGMDPDLGGDRKAPRSFTFGVNVGF